ncbi:YadA-like family protein [Mesorhizobium sp. BR1-1-9]|uniref:YadA-like family protein n=1 Tax=unclassified Mesorhizobium TaxID=325217 RepID=UPI001CD04704|nr:MULTISPECIES: YadA-like family protein [unclassified Mesorhizobium]MBZ9873176.1 YadA-like family protein [Mesorhizobium sp. BR1-1-9]MBZ9945013.1 YadA-like family protein [Mesorhizobium sp. BR1-1-13]
MMLAGTKLQIQDPLRVTSIKPIRFAVSLLVLALVALPVIPGRALADECLDEGSGGFSCGFNSLAGEQSAAYGIGSAAGDHATALGYQSWAAGGDNVAVGADTRASLGASNTDNVAIGTDAWAGATAAGQNNSVAVGSSARSNAANATSLGANAGANFNGAMALGSDAQATRDNQVMLGTAGNTYTLAGVNSQASKGAQSGMTYLMTTDGDGNLAASTFDVATLENLPAQVAQNSSDITDLSTTVNNNTTQITANTAELADHETRITNNTAQITANTAELADHEMRITNNTAQITTNTAELADHETRITNNTNTLNVHTTQIAGLDSRVTTNTNNIALLDGRVGALESGVQDLGNQISENRSEARAGTALALATAGLRYDDRPGKLSLAGGFGNFKGQSGLALGLGYNPSLDFRLNGAISATTNHGDVGVSLGASWTLN